MLDLEFAVNFKNKKNYTELYLKMQSYDYFQ